MAQLKEGVWVRSAGRKRIAKLIWALLAVWMAFSLSGCVWRAGPGAGGSDASGAGSAPLSGSEKSSENPGVPHGEKNPRSPGGGYRLAAQNDYPYGSGPSAFALYPEAGSRAHGGFSAGGLEEDLYVFDLANQNVKVLRKTDAALLKVVELPGEAARADGADLGVDENGVIYVLAIGANRTVRVVAFDDAGKVLSVYSVPEGAAEKPPVYGRDKLVRTQEGGWFYGFRKKAAFTPSETGGSWSAATGSK